jgi:hypothetical protein
MRGRFMISSPVICGYFSFISVRILHGRWNTLSSVCTPPSAPGFSRKSSSDMTLCGSIPRFVEASVQRMFLSVAVLIV